MNIKKFAAALGAATAAIALSASAHAASVAIVQGGFYTPDLKNALVGAGQTVTEITSYTAATLTGFDAVIQYGNTFVDQAALTTYVNAGGILVSTPWAGLNFAVTPALQVRSNGGSAIFSESSIGMTVLAAGDPLLSGVAFPAAGTVNVGRISGTTFIGGVTQVANWADGAALAGYKSVGAGKSVDINLHVITSDTAYQVINTPWATQLFVNAVNLNVAAVPESSTWMMMIVGFGMIGGATRYRRGKTNVSFG
jgi:hypothetical protein